MSLKISKNRHQQGGSETSYPSSPAIKNALPNLVVVILRNRLKMVDEAEFESATFSFGGHGISSYANRAGTIRREVCVAPVSGYERQGRPEQIPTVPSPWQVKNRGRRPPAIPA